MCKLLLHLSITIPSTASPRPTRMRVSTKFNGIPTSCEIGFDGEVEDYTINVIQQSITTGAISPTSYCAGKRFLFLFQSPVF